MENKKKQQSLHSLIYVLLAAMLACVVFVSIYTVASRRHSAPAKDSTDEVTSGQATDSRPPEPRPAESTDDKSDPDPADSAKPSDSGTADTAKTSGKAEPSDISASTGIRYYVMPVTGSVAKEFQIDVPVYSLTMNDYRAHTGVDLCAPIGSEVLSVSSGTVCRIYSDPMMGQCVTVDHGDNIYSTYMNLGEELADRIEVGARLSMGQILGVIGETSLTEIAEEPHLHLEMKMNGEYVNPLDYIKGDETVVYQD